MNTASRLLASTFSLHLPGAPLGSTVAAELGRPRGEWAWREAATPERAATVLGRAALLDEPPAARLALCAVHRALGLAAGQRRGWVVSPGTAVVAVSSTAMATSVATWFGFGGPNLLVCSGTNAGLDGLVLADLLLRSRRADRVVLVGAEPADEVAVGERPEPVLAAAPLCPGAACLVLQMWQPGVPGRPGQALVELLRRDDRWPRPPRVLIGRGGFDPVQHWGDCHRAQDVVALALAAHLAADEGHRVVAVRSGLRRVLVSAVEVVRTPFVPESNDREDRRPPVTACSFRAGGYDTAQVDTGGGQSR